MKKPFAVVALALMAACLSAHAVQTVELKDYPPLKPLHYCKDSAGQVQGQTDECGPGLTEVSSISTSDGNGHVTYGKLGATLDSPNGPPAAAPVVSQAATPPSAVASESAGDKDIMRRGRKSLLKFLAFALVFGVVAKLMGRSFVIWFIVGGFLEVVLVAAAFLSP